MSSVSLDAAMGTITLQRMLLRPPSMARVLLRPTRPSLAALKEEWNINCYQEDVWKD